MDRFLPIFYFVGWLGLIFGASYLINWLLVRSIIRRAYRFFVAPGVIVHELSHAVGCLITGSEIVEINFWKSTGGHVKHLQSHDALRRLVSDPIIALAPIWGTFAVLAFFTWFLFPDIFSLIATNDLIALINSFDLTSATTWLYLYVVTSLVATIAPSKTDMKYALASLVVLFSLLVALLFLPGFSEQVLVAEATLRPFALFTLGLLSIALFIAFILALPNRDKHFVPHSQIE